MDLIFFDLDGTLLNKDSVISPFTQDTLARLKHNNIAYTVATGRTMLSGQKIVNGHSFDLPHIYNNGVTVWDPLGQDLTLDNLLSDNEVSIIIDCALSHGVTPFVNAINVQDKSHNHYIYHSPTQHQVEKDLVNKYFSRIAAQILPLNALSKNCQVTNISMIGDAHTIREMWLKLNTYEHLVGYSGPASEGKQYSWMDVHHGLANKGTAVKNVKQQFGASNVICFGDSDNDLSMFALADECYAPANANAEIKSKANAVIGHHDEDGVAHFLRQRFSL